MWSVFKRNAIKVYNKNIRIPTCIDISKQVKHALQNNLPIVALESTIITHGMPYPKNLMCAQEVESVVRENGATPATIAILGGRIKVGLSTSQLTELADTEKKKPIKTSRRDFGYVLANKLNGGTTVAGTLIVAKEVGIEVFGTGGLGGVHRDAAVTFDISADLIELGNSPVAVVSSGVKSILDIPKTLEYLETQGVFVATFGKDKAFPAFYCRTSNCDAPYNVTSAFEAANIIRNHFNLGLKSGLLFAVPVLEEFAMDPQKMDKIIEQALLSANKKDISGKEITPYLLSEISKITQGSSLETNIALIKNNAKVATNIAVELTKLKRESNGNTRVPGKYVSTDIGNKPRSVLKRLWDKLRRRKSILAEERRELMATGGGPPKPPASRQPEFDNLIPHLNFETNVDDDFEGINLKNNAQGTSALKKPHVYKENDGLNELKKARLQLIKREEAQMEELHMIRMKEAQYRREAAKFLMMQEEKKK
ncbi:hypothetical protein RN001_008668 [Aquatica leii]|uniref:Pseudouridine-5'-phosphate glycosidase n=1 Tax=Aquatica leii TaxID=1421715 RepID=A0AAN7PZC7_9COLE|nr:hypothetical protein RN001_008668 [Aquatica leii]